MKSFSHGSDTEDEVENSISRIQVYPNSPEELHLRGLRLHPNEITFSLSDQKSSAKNVAYLYEIILSLWVHSSMYPTTSNDTADRAENQLFFQQMDLLLPLCLKSLALRCFTDRKLYQLVPSNILDLNHMLLIEPLINVLTHELVNHSVIADSEIDDAIADAIAQSDSILDFIIGLMGIIHPAQVSYIISTYFQSLRTCEVSQGNSPGSHMPKIRVNRQLRLRAVERLATIPQFAAMNFPYKFHSFKWEESKASCSWINQVTHVERKHSAHKLLRPPDGKEYLPEANWLSQLILNECLSICSQCSEVLVNGTVSQVKANMTSKKKSAMRQRVPVSKEDLAHYYAIGNHSITIVHELILKFHSCDERYQSESASSRIAGMFVSAVIENTLEATQTLSKMSPYHKIRTVWLLCLLYVLQEAPETALGQEMHSMCTKKVSSVSCFPSFHTCITGAKKSPIILNSPILRKV